MKCISPFASRARRKRKVFVNKQIERGPKKITQPLHKKVRWRRMQRHFDITFSNECCIFIEKSKQYIVNLVFVKKGSFQGPSLTFFCGSIEGERSTKQSVTRWRKKV